MIFLTRLNQSSFVVNSDLIEHIEVTPDTVLALTTGEKILVRESAEEVVARTVQFRRSLLEGLSSCVPLSPHHGPPSRSHEPDREKPFAR